MQAFTSEVWWVYDRYRRNARSPCTFISQPYASIQAACTVCIVPYDITMPVSCNTKDCMQNSDLLCHNLIDQHAFPGVCVLVVLLVVTSKFPAAQDFATAACLTVTQHLKLIA